MSDFNDSFGSKNKTVGQNFDWVNIKGDMPSRFVSISPMGA